MLINAICGPVESGQEDKFAYYYFGIPYAKAGRFEDPAELEPFLETFKADGEKEEFNKLYIKAKEIAKDLESQKKNAYVYYFAHPLKGDKRGSFHSSELWYMFGTLDKCWRPMDEDDYKLSERMLDDWASFMKNGKPSFDSFKEGHIEVYE